MSRSILQNPTKKFQLTIQYGSNFKILSIIISFKNKHTYIFYYANL
jgi:hypothetical protein